MSWGRGGFQVGGLAPVLLMSPVSPVFHTVVTVSWHSSGNLAHERTCACVSFPFFSSSATQARQIKLLCCLLISGIKDTKTKAIGNRGLRT